MKTSWLIPSNTNMDCSEETGDFWGLILQKGCCSQANTETAPSGCLLMVEIS